MHCTVSVQPSCSCLGVLPLHPPRAGDPALGSAACTGNIQRQLPVWTTEARASCSRSSSGSASNEAPVVQLPPALQLHILSLLPLNDRALSGRLASPDTAAALTGPDHCTASLSQPLPPHAARWAVEAGQQHVRQLPFWHKLQLMRTAAASGSEVNLEVAWDALQPSVFPELLQHGAKVVGLHLTTLDPGFAAIKTGHVQLLGWLLRRCPGLLGPAMVLVAAARHSDLAGLQAAWVALRDGHPSRSSSDTGDRPVLGQWVLDAAAGSTTQDAEAKIQWVLDAGQGLALRDSTAAAAAGLGDVGRLQWLWERGCPMGGSEVLQSALEHAALAVAQWLVEKAGCTLPAAADDDRSWSRLFGACVKSPDGAAKLQWLRERGAPPLHADHLELEHALLMTALARGGHVEVLQYLLQQPGLRTERGLRELCKAAAQSGSIPMVELLRQQAGCVFTPEAYCYAARSGSLAMIRWLADEAGVAPAGLPTGDFPHLMRCWPNDTPARSRGLLQAVQLLVGEAGCRDWNAEGAPTGYGIRRIAREAVQTAAGRGDLALVQYLLQQAQGYQPGWEVLVAAAEGSCEALLEWLVEQQGCHQRTGRGSPYFWTAFRGDLGTLTTLRRLGVPWSELDTVAQAVLAKTGVLALRWLVEQGAPVGPGDEVDQAVAARVRKGTMEPQTAAWLRGLAAAGQGSGGPVP